MIATDATVSLLSFYINGAWERADGPLRRHHRQSGHRRRHRRSALRRRRPMSTAPSAPRTRLFSNGATSRWSIACRCCTASRRCSKSMHGDLAATLTARKRQDHRGRQARSAPRHPDGGSGLRHAQPDDGRFAERRGARASTAKPSASPSASASASRRSISPRWCRCGCIRSPSPAATPSC